MLPDSRIAGFSGNFSFAGPRWLFSFGMGFVSNIRRNMLFYYVLQSLGGASYVARITLARKFIYNRTFFVWQERSPFEWTEGPFSYYKQHVG